MAETHEELQARLDRELRARLDSAERVVEFKGERFELRPKVSQYALAKFAQAASAGTDAESLQGVAAMMNLLRKCIVAEDWARFDKTADDHDAEFSDLMTVIQAAMESTTERPTGRSSDLSDGPTATEPKSGSSAVDRALEKFSGRPDFQLAILQQERQAAAS